MSATTFAGSAQVAAVSILGAGGGLGAAIAAALLLNARYGAISISVGSRFTGSVWRRLLESQLVVDESWALSLREDGKVERRELVGAGAALWVFWTGGTVVGGVVGTALGDPKTLGLDGAFGALFVALLVPHLGSRRAVAAALGGAALALAPALLSALVVVETFADGRKLALDPRAAGLATAAVAVGLRAQLLGVIVVAAVTTALVRAL